MSEPTSSLLPLLRQRRQQLRQRLQEWRRRRSLTLGLRRLTRWKSRLLQVTRVLRADLEFLPVDPNQHLVLTELRLPNLPLRQVTLEWALLILEDLHFLLLELEAQTKQALSETSEPE